MALAKYLVENGYYHKYLSGGEVEDGKIFTIYFGSRKMIDKWVPIISRELKERLARPKHGQEVELAEGIIGRFAVREKGHPSFNEYTPYGQLGMPLLRLKARGKEIDRYLHYPSDKELQEVFSNYAKILDSILPGNIRLCSLPFAPISE